MSSTTVRNIDPDTYGIVRGELMEVELVLTGVAKLARSGGGPLALVLIA